MNRLCRLLALAFLTAVFVGCGDKNKPATTPGGKVDAGKADEGGAAPPPPPPPPLPGQK